MSQPAEHIATPAGTSSALEQRVLLLAAARADVETCQSILGGAGIGVAVCADLTHACRELLDGAAALLLTEDALAQGQIGELMIALASQPQWSELPILMLTRDGAQSPQAAWVVQHLHSVVLLERPVQRLTLLTTVRAAVMNRQRQYQLRRYLIEQRRAEEAQHEGERRLRLFIEHAPAALAMFDRQMRYLLVSRRWLSDYGLEGQDLLGRSHYEVFPEIPERWKEIHRRALNGEVIRAEEDCFLRADGSVQWLRWEVRPWHDAAGEIAGMVAFTEDVTQRRAAREALQESRQRVSADLDAVIQLQRLGTLSLRVADLETILAEVVDAAIAISDADFGNIQLLDPKTADLTIVAQRGFSKPWLDFWSSVSKGKGACGTALERGERVIVEDVEHSPIFAGTPALSVQLGQGVRAVQSTPLVSRSGKPVGMLSTHFRQPHRPDERALRLLDLLARQAADVIERAQAEEALRKSERLYRAIGETIDYGIWVCDPQGRNTYMSESFLRLLGMTQEECSTFGWADALHPDEAEATLAAWKACVERGEAWYCEHRYRGADGRWHPVLSCGVPVRDEQGETTAWAGINLDISRLKRAEEELAAAKAAAEGANAAKDHFLAVLSHELRTPLTPVLPLLEELATQVPEIAREDIEMARRNVELEARLIDDLLDVTRISRGKIELHREVTDLETILRRAAEVCMPDIEARRLHFGITIEGGPYPVEADPARLQQVFWNLLKNAIKFTPHGRHVEVRCQSHAGQVVTEVTDSGIGIEPAALARLFNAFEQTDRSVTRQFGGLGLGLAISRALVELHGGTIQVHSEGKGKGATFTVKLPLLRAAERKVLSPAPRRRAPATQTPAAARPLQILLVEDHGDTARIMRRMLQNKGHRVETAGDVTTALELAQKRSFDLVLSDLGLPDRSGLELMEGLHQMGRDIPGIALSGYGQDEDVRRSHEAGFREHLTKPVNIGQLEAAIGQVAMAKAM